MRDDCPDTSNCHSQPRKGWKIVEHVARQGDYVVGVQVPVEGARRGKRESPGVEV